jgi:hypothetical protein
MRRCARQIQGKFLSERPRLNFQTPSSLNPFILVKNKLNKNILFRLNKRKSFYLFKILKII